MHMIYTYIYIQTCIFRLQWLLFCNACHVRTCARSTPVCTFTRAHFHAWFRHIFALGMQFSTLTSPRCMPLLGILHCMIVGSPDYWVYSGYDAFCVRLKTKQSTTWMRVSTTPIFYVQWYTYCLCPTSVTHIYMAPDDCTGKQLDWTVRIPWWKRWWRFVFPTAARLRNVSRC